MKKLNKDYTLYYICDILHSSFFVVSVFFSNRIFSKKGFYNPTK